MTIDKSLRVKRGATRNRSVLTRVERIARLQEADIWKEGDSPLGLPKVRVRKLTMKKKKKKKEEEGAEGAAGGAAAAPAAAAGQGGHQGCRREGSGRRHKGGAKGGAQAGREEVIAQARTLLRIPARPLGSSRNGSSVGVIGPAWPPSWQRELALVRRPQPVSAPGREFLPASVRRLRFSRLARWR